MLAFENFSKTYPGGKRAVDRLNLSVEAGDIYGFIGHNGAGKTTAIRAAVGALAFEEGEIRIGGMSVREQPVACKALTAYIPDSPTLYDYLTGMQYNQLYRGCVRHNGTGAAGAHHALCGSI